MYKDEEACLNYHSAELSRENIHHWFKTFYHDRENDCMLFSSHATHSAGCRLLFAIPNAQQVLQRDKANYQEASDNTDTSLKQELAAAKCCELEF